MDIGAALGEAARIGPFFEISTLPPGAAGAGSAGPVGSAGSVGSTGGGRQGGGASPDSGWRSLGVLVSEPDVVRERVTAARAAMARRAGLPIDAVEPRATASIVFLGLAARLVSAPLATGVLAGAVPRWTLGDLFWQAVPGGPWPVAARPVDGGATLGATILGGVVEPVLDAFRREFRLSPKVLWGNVASALAGAAGILAGARPDRAEAAYDLVAGVLTAPPLLGTGELVRPDARYTQRFFVRRSCCLLYRVPGGGTCGDCVLVPADVRRARWKAAFG